MAHCGRGELDTTDLVDAPTGAVDVFEPDIDRREVRRETLEVPTEIRAYLLLLYGVEIQPRDADMQRRAVNVRGTRVALVCARNPGRQRSSRLFFFSHSHHVPGAQSVCRAGTSA